MQKISLLKRNQLLMGSYNYFSNNKSVKKIQTIGFANSNIEDMKNLSYKIKRKINFIDGRYLIYRSKHAYYRIFKSYFIYISSIFYFLYLLYSQKYVDTYPIAKHMYVAALATILFLTTRKFMHNQNIVKQINLLQGGKATQIIFENQYKRKIFGQMTSKTLYNSLFVSPQTQQLAILNPLPKDLNELDAQGWSMSSYWRKYYSNNQNYLLIPVRYDHIDKQILNEVMNGKIIIS